MKRIIATAVAVMALLALPGVAFANGSSTCSSYNPQLSCQVVSSASDGPSSTPSTGTTTATTGSLPFTGLDLGFLAAGGVVLIGAGLVARRFSAQR